jgi:hypothetical protein
MKTVIMMKIKVNAQKKKIKIHKTIHFSDSRKNIPILYKEGKGDPWKTKIEAL